MIHSNDVFHLTKKGGSELQGANTSLAPVVLELLLRIDGKSDIEELASRMPHVALPVLIDAARSLVMDERISLVKRTEYDLLEFEFENASPPLPASAHAGKRAELMAADGVSSLQRQGYYVRIARRPAARPRLPTDRKPLVVIIEDEPLLAQFLKHFMAFEGFESRTAANRDEIVRALSTAPVPDLILLDVVLPDADGFNVLVKIREHAALRAVPTLMLTAKTTRESVIRGFAGGADGYITKPFQTEVLTRAIRTLFGLQHEAKGDVWSK